MSGEITLNRYYGSQIRTIRGSLPASAINPRQVRSYADELIRLCRVTGLNTGALWSQALHETGEFSSDAWAVNLNPAGLKTGNGIGYQSYFNGTDAARAHVVHMAAYVWGVSRDGGLGVYFYLDDRIAAVQDWVNKNGTVDTLAELAKGWAEDANYANAVAARYGRLFAPKQASVAVLLVSGHRNRSGGNPDETARTDDLALAYAAALDSAGIRNDWLQEIDGDLDPDYTEGDLGSVAIKARQWIEQQRGSGDMPVMLDLHFEGGGAPGVFAIVPDAPGDTLEANSLDVDLARRIASGIANRSLLTRRVSGVVEPGVMSERQTGVGATGARLGMFALTASTNRYAVRLVVEHGSLDRTVDRAIIDSPGFYDWAARGAVDGLLKWAEANRLAIKGAMP